MRLLNYNRRGVAVEYAILIMLVVVAFTLTILITSSSSLTQASEYNTYMVNKTNLDEIGYSYIAYYCNDLGDLEDIKTNAEEYGYTVADFSKDSAKDLAEYKRAIVTVSANGTVRLTIQFGYDSENQAITLERYVYGEI